MRLLPETFAGFSAMADLAGRDAGLAPGGGGGGRGGPPDDSGVFGQMGAAQAGVAGRISASAQLAEVQRRHETQLTITPPPEVPVIMGDSDACWHMRVPTRT